MTTETPENERRHYQRIPFIAEVIMSKGDEEWSCGLLDISLKGVLVEPPSNESPDRDAHYTIELILSEDAAIKMEAKISHSDNDTWGLVWENIDLDGLTHLRRLLELNMSDPDEMHRELAELG